MLLDMLQQTIICIQQIIFVYHLRIFLFGKEAKTQKWELFAFVIDGNLWTIRIPGTSHIVIRDPEYQTLHV